MATTLPRTYVPARAETEARAIERPGSLLRWLAWSPAIAIVVSAFAIPGIGLVLFLLPLLGLGYFVFALIAWIGAAERDGRSEHDATH